jgi:putative hydrolases of HD superfamily
MSAFLFSPFRIPLFFLVFISALTNHTTLAESMASSTQSPNDFLDPEAALNYLKYAGGLKRTPRTGWVYSGVREHTRVESVSDHSWRMAAAAFLFAGDPSYNVGKMIQMAVLHDIAESIIGDIAPADNIGDDEKQRREVIATKQIMDNLGAFSSIGASNANALIDEYEARQTSDSIAVKDLDMLEMIVQVRF